jgi:hypothetical protein
MCNCLKDVAEKLEVRLKEQIGMANVYSFDHIGFDNMVFSLGDGKHTEMSSIADIVLKKYNQ